MFIHFPFAGAPAPGWSCTRCWGEKTSKTPWLSSHSSQSRGGTGAGGEPWRPRGAGSQECPHRSLGAGPPQARTELPQPRVWRLQNGANCTFPWLSWGATQAWGLLAPHSVTVALVALHSCTESQFPSLQNGKSQNLLLTGLE